MTNKTEEAQDAKDSKGYRSNWSRAGELLTLARNIRRDQLIATRRKCKDSDVYAELAEDFLPFYDPEFKQIRRHMSGGDIDSKHIPGYVRWLHTR